MIQSAALARAPRTSYLSERSRVPGPFDFSYERFRIVASEREGRRQLLTNPEEPRTGEFAYNFYDASHPIFGDASTVNRLKGELRGLRGEELIVRINGRRIDESGIERRFQVTRTVTYRNYSDIFGPGSVYASGIHAVRERHSDEELVTDSITIELAS